MATLPVFPPRPFQPIADPVDEAAHAYDAVGEDYLRYADGDADILFDFTSRYSFADREIWNRIDRHLVALKAQERFSIRIVDAGCGPGTWLIRTVLRARALGFTAIEGRGFDISPAMIALANGAARAVRDPAIGLLFETADIETALASEMEAPADMVLCLYGVMNHLPRERHAAVANALMAAGDMLLITVRTIGSLPSIFVSGMESARNFHQDNDHDRLEIDLVDGRHIGFPSHLFSADEFTSLFGGCGRIAERFGLDLFHGRFTPDRRWNPENLPDLGFSDALIRLEHLCGSDPTFLDRAAHILLHVQSVR